MYIITNRRITAFEGGYDIFEKTPNSIGIGELRLVEMITKNGDESFRILEDKLSMEKVKKLNKKFKLELDLQQEYYASLDVAAKLFQKARKTKKQILVFVHGYNNDMKDIVQTAKKLEATYNVIALIFSWPANGEFTGVVNYKSDKKDARESAGALNSFLKKLHYYHEIFINAEVKKLLEKAQNKHPNNPLKAKEKYVELQKRSCKVSINLLCHSMGNYLLKYEETPSDRSLKVPIFDNICLVAADVNNKNHKEWVEKIEVKSNLYIVINKHDYALAFSRIKPNEEQLARLGQYRKGLNAKNATYIDVTNADSIQTEHTYFVDTVDYDRKLKNVFANMFEGRDAEDGLVYQSSNNSYVFK